MQNTNLSKLLATIDKEEMKAFGCYLKGMHPGRKRIHTVQEYLAKTHPTYEAKRLVRSKVIKYVFDKNVNERALLNLYSELAGFLEDFLAVREMDKHPFVKDYLLIRNYERINNRDLFVKQIEKAQDHLRFIGGKNKIQAKTGLFSSLKSLILHHLKYFYSNDPAFLMQKDNWEVQLALNDLNNFQKVSNLCYQAEIANRKKLYKIDLEPDWKETKTTTLLNELYNLKYALISQQTESDFLNLKDFLFSHYIHFDSQEHSSTISYLCNYLSDSIRKGNLECLTKVLNLYKQSHQANILIVDNYLSSDHYHNIINVASSLGEYVWLDLFLVDFHKTIKESSHSSLIKLGKAQFFFGEGKYDKATDFLKDIDYDNPYYEFRAKAIILRSFFLLEESEEFITNYYRSFLSKVRRCKTMNQTFIKGYENFLIFFRKICINNVANDIVEQINQERNLQCRKWLLGIVN